MLRLTRNIRTYKVIAAVMLIVAVYTVFGLFFFVFNAAG